MFRTLHSKLLITLLTSGLVFSLPMMAQAGLYKYVDEDGNVVYSQTPPTSGDYKSVKIPKESRKQKLTSEQREAKRQKARESILGTKTGDEAGKEGADKSGGATGPTAKSKEDKLIRDEAKKNRDERKKLCAQAREAKRKLEVYRRFRDEKGNVIRYSDEERAKRLKNANEAVKQFCS